MSIKIVAWVLVNNLTAHMKTTNLTISIGKKKTKKIKYT